MSVVVARAAARRFELPKPETLAVVAAVVIGLASLPFAVFGLAQLATTTAAQLSGPAHVTDFVAIYSGPWQVLHDPEHLYQPGAAAAIDRALTQSDRFDRPFSFLPQAALVLAPLAFLPYGAAYLAWLVVGTAALAASAWLLAPRSRVWPALLVLFLPAQLGLIMGQTSPLALVAFCGLVRLIDRRPGVAGLMLGLSPAVWKPQLLAPALGLAALAARRWRLLVGLAVGPLALTAAFTAISGPGWLADYRAQADSMWALVAQGSSIESAGQTLLALAQALLGPSAAATDAFIAATALVELGVVAVWRPGLLADTRRDLQLAMLPLAGTLAAPHALGYDLTLWLASAWLLLRYVKTRPSARGLVYGLCLLSWACANVAILTENDGGFPLAAVAGLAFFAATLALFFSHPRHPRRKPAVTGANPRSGVDAPRQRRLGHAAD